MHIFAVPSIHKKTIMLNKQNMQTLTCLRRSLTGEQTHYFCRVLDVELWMHTAQDRPNYLMHHVVELPTIHCLIGADKVSAKSIAASKWWIHGRYCTDSKKPRNYMAFPAPCVQLHVDEGCRPPCATVSWSAWKNTFQVDSEWWKIPFR